MPNRVRRVRGRNPRRNRNRTITPLNRTMPFQSTLSQVQLKAGAQGLSTFDFNTTIMAQEFNASTVGARQICFRQVIARFYPMVQVSLEKPAQVSVQLGYYDLATSTKCPLTPIVPLSSTNKTTLRANIGQMIFQQVGGGVNTPPVFYILTTSTQILPIPLVDLSFRWRLRIDPLYPQSLLLSPSETQPIQEFDNMVMIENPPDSV